MAIASLPVAIAHLPFAAASLAIAPAMRPIAPAMLAMLASALPIAMAERASPIASFAIAMARDASAIAAHPIAMGKLAIPVAALAIAIGAFPIAIGKRDGAVARFPTAIARRAGAPSDRDIAPSSLPLAIGALAIAMGTPPIAIGTLATPTGRLAIPTGRLAIPTGGLATPMGELAIAPSRDAIGAACFPIAPGKLARPLARSPAPPSASDIAPSTPDVPPSLSAAPPVLHSAAMTCFHGYPAIEGNEASFSVDLSAITFGAGVLHEAGDTMRALGCRRVALFTDARVARLAPTERALASIRAAGLDVAVYDAVHVEPTDASFRAAADFARAGRFDGYVSVGGGSVIDTCKAALLYATYPADLLAYVNAPIGAARPVPGPLPPHVACPTTCGTGSECTGIAVFDYLEMKAKTGIASRALRPTRALIDPTATHSLPPMVVAASGFDVLCHALESYTARPFTARPRPATPAARPMSQGRNPWSDVGALEALRLGGRYLVRAVRDASDHEAREGLSWAATLAGIAFGNAGVHLPHAMSYSVAGLVRDYRAPGYPDGEALVPHGISVAVNAPSVFRATAATSPERHLAAAEALGADTRGAGPGDVAEVLATALVDAMRATGVPLGVGALGYGEADVEPLARGAIVQKRLVDNAPMPVDDEAMRALFRAALRYA